MLQALRRDYVPPALLDALRVSVMTQWELYFFDADELDDDSIADDGKTQRKRKRTETEGGPTPAGENGTVCRVRVCVCVCVVTASNATRDTKAHESIAYGWQVACS